MTEMIVEDHVKECARDALELKAQIDQINKKLDDRKSALREAAAGNGLKIVVEGLGYVQVQKPSMPKTKISYSVNTDKLLANPELLQKLLKSDIIKKVESRAAPRQPNVIIKNNV